VVVLRPSLVSATPQHHCYTRSFPAARPAAAHRRRHHCQNASCLPISRCSTDAVSKPALAFFRMRDALLYYLRRTRLHFTSWSVCVSVCCGMR